MMRQPRDAPSAVLAATARLSAYAPSAQTACAPVSVACAAHCLVELGSTMQNVSLSSASAAATNVFPIPVPA